MPASHTATRTLALTLAATIFGACADAPAAPAADGGRLAQAVRAPNGGRLASIELAGRFPALYLQNADGSDRVRVRFTDVRDDVPGNDVPFPMPVTDGRIVALGPAKWSPDGQRLAIVVSLGTDQSEVVVMRADGSQMAVASINKQIIIGDVDWSPDGRRIAYAMSTDAFGRSGDLFATDLAGSAVQRVTTTRRLSLLDEYRWDERGARLWFTQLEGMTPDERHRVFGVYQVAPGGAPVATGGRIVGDPQGIARDGSWALALRATPPYDGLHRALLRVPLGHGHEKTLAAGNALYAELLEGDEEAVLVSADPLSDERRYDVRGLHSAHDLRATLPIAPSATSIALWANARR